MAFLQAAALLSPVEWENEEEKAAACQKSLSQELGPSS
jgi:hypothetical protein